MSYRKSGHSEFDSESPPAFLPIPGRFRIGVRNDTSGFGRRSYFTFDNEQHWVHIYTRDGKYLDSFGGPGDDVDNFSTLHGINIDDRSGEPVVQVADREHVRIANFSLEGAFIETIVSKEELRYPCAIIHADGKMYVPDLFARLSIFDAHHNKIVDLGDYVDGGTLTSWDDFGTEYPELEGYPNLPHEKRLPGKFSSLHDLWVDGEGSIYVVEWVEDGRVTKMTKV